jgi:hypothetical protein
MEPIVFKISSRHDRFLDFYGPLARNLRGSGTVYTPYPDIPLNARIAVPPPSEVLVSLKSTEAFHLVHQTMRNYVEGHEERELLLEKGDRSVTITAHSLPEETTLMDKLALRT